MTAAVDLLPEAPGGAGMWPGWWRSSGPGTQPTVHRLVAEDGRRTARTVCGRRLTVPEWASGPSRRRIRVCSTCCAVMDGRTAHWAAQPAPSAPTDARPQVAPEARPVDQSDDQPAIAAPPSTEPDLPPLVALMAGAGYDLDRVLAEHRDDGRGHCRVCGGPQSGRVRWPCDLLRTGRRAADVRNVRAHRVVRVAAGATA